MLISYILANFSLSYVLVYIYAPVVVMGGR